MIAVFLAATRSVVMGTLHVGKVDSVGSTRRTACCTCLRPVENHTVKEQGYIKERREGSVQNTRPQMHNCSKLVSKKAARSFPHIGFQERRFLLVDGTPKKV
jgi:hypothetical protein